MADQIVSSLLSRACDAVLDQICGLLKYEYGLLGGLTDDVQKLEKLIDDFRKIAEEKGGKIFASNTTKDWLFDVNRAVDDAERMVEEAQNLPPVCHSFPTVCFTCFSVRERRAVGQRLGSLFQEFDRLGDKRNNLSFKEIDSPPDHVRETGSAVPKGVVGRDALKEKIINVLLSEATNQSCVYAIIGPGGIGKTTFVQLIFNDTRVKHHFKLTIWVWVSQTFVAKKVMEKIIEIVSRQKPDFETLEATQNRLKELLSGNKFLLVLDDIWNENTGDWDQLKCSFNCGATGSCIILTTRGSNVASVADARVHDQFKMPVLSEDECWQVFKEYARFDESQENGVSLEVIGKQIAKKCGGLPLAAKSLGGSLRLTREGCEWESARDSNIWEQPGDVLPALKLSLDRLDTHSRNCFTFCCVFPKGYQMEKEELIQLWMANDLIPSQSRLELEDMGTRFFNNLVAMSFFQVGYHPMIITIHDLMHDLCLYFRKECFCLEDSDIQIPPQIQHLSVDCSLLFGTDFLETLSKSHPSLRTCIFLYEFYGKKINFKTLSCLRVLNLMNAELEDLPISIRNVKDLKYLNLCGNEDLTNLPNSMGDLIKLQTLNLRNCESLTQLPEEMTRLVNLRCFDLSGCKKLTHLPDGIGGLIQLRHLDLSECKKLTHLPDGIGGLIQLRHLDLSGCEKLTHLPDGIGGLIQLRHLDLSWCEKLTHLPDGIGGLIQLRHFDLSGCMSLTHLPNDITGLVKLEHLHLSCCDHSRQLPNGMGQLVNLRTLMLNLFVVGRDDKQRIIELKRLNCLKGELEIYGLENVRDATEATEAMLKEKNNLSSLCLIWGSSQGSDSSSSDEAEAVLEALQPPESLNKKLVIDGYGGSVFPRWMQILHNLVEIELKSCIKCERLPPLGQLRHLEVLKIRGMESLKCIDTEFYGSNRSSGGRTIFPSLVKLVIEYMPNLEELEDLKIKDSQQTEACPCLEQLTISICKSLKSLPECLPNLSNLRILDVAYCEELELSSEDFQSLISLETLDLVGLPKLTSFPALQHFSKLERLEIINCWNLIRLVPQGMMQNSTVLGWIRFEDCDQLELSSTDLQHLLELQKIYLLSLPKLTSIPALQHFSKLEELKIKGCKNLISLRPQGMLQNPTTVLKRIWLDDCEQLELSSTDFQHLLQLQGITLNSLPKLTSFRAMQHFSQLEELEIKGCKNLISSGPQGMMQNLTTVLGKIEFDDC